MATNKLNTKFCENAQVGNHFDGGGLYLKVSPDGTKRWFMAIRLDGKKKLFSFGTFKKVFLAQARERRQEAEDLIKAGVDPVQSKKNQKMSKVNALQAEAHKQGRTFEQIARRLIASKAETKKATEEYCQKMLRLFEIHVFPHIGHF